MKKIYWLSIVSLLLIAFLSGCQKTSSDNPITPSTYPGVGSTQEVSGDAYPSPTISPLLNISAFDAYEIAKKEIEKNNPKAVLYSIPATFMMEMNLGYPPTGDGWFFMFKEPNQELELYVFIYDGKVAGTTNAVPLYFEDTPPYTYIPLPSLNSMIDSDKFMDLYMKNGGENYLKNNPGARLNSQLFLLEGNDFPIWSMYDIESLS